MVDVEIVDDVVRFTVRGMHKVWALKSQLEIPVKEIESVEIPEPELARGWWKGLRMPGTHVPGLIIAGTFYQKGKRIFWDVTDPDSVVQFLMKKGGEYDELIVEVEDPEEVVERVSEALPSAAA